MIDGNRRAIALDELFLEGLHTMLGKLVYERRCVDHTRGLGAYFGLGRGSKPSNSCRRWLERCSKGFGPCIGASPHIGLYFVSSMNSPAGAVCLVSVAIRGSVGSVRGLSARDG